MARDRGGRCAVLSLVPRWRGCQAPPSSSTITPAAQCVIHTEQGRGRREGGRREERRERRGREGGREGGRREGREGGGREERRERRGREGGREGGRSGRVDASRHMFCRSSSQHH